VTGRSLTLCYHAVSDSWDCSLAVSREQLERQLRHLVNRGYAGATLSEIVRGEAPGKALAVTFDDGYRSVIDRALPVLSELGLPGTVFVPTNFMGGSGPMSWPGIDSWLGTADEDELLPMSWEQLRELRERGWEVGSHTRSHPHLSQLDDGDLAAELSESRDTCTRELGADCTSIAYPYGDHDERVAAAAERAGYLVAAKLSPGPERRFAWPRVGVYPIDRDWRFQVKTSGAMRRVRASRLGDAVEAARSRRSGR
jgi:peptidoglycan/xylan/chitin deacetylase (PgdA/CDA1 family)